MSSETAPPKKFRASCENCARSKVRCAKGNSRCQRCARKDLLCEYGPAQRARRSQSDTESTAVETSSAGSGMSGPRQAYTNDDFCSMDLDVTTHGSSMGSVTSPELGNYLEVEDFMAGIAHPGSPDFLYWLSQPPKAVPRAEDSTKEDMFPAPGGVTAHAGFPGGPDGTENTIADGNATAGCISNCAIMPLNILKTLGPSLDTYTDALSDLGTVLKTSRTALDSATLMVSCPCSATTDMALLATSVILRILSWHLTIFHSLQPKEKKQSGQADAKGRLEQQGPSTTHDLGPDARGSATAQGLCMPAINIGTYELELEERPLLIMHIIQGDLSRMEAVLDLFSKRFCRSNGHPFGEDNNEKLHQVLEMFLRRKHNATLADIKKDLGLM
ncbi:Uu.00g140350.m01.CDS01 [Anthostomella pinea]|uniref:Uu.00g140350.m01.CDS01 n=1 Tax=Anthostomella pinea TaxID=933095 RepID=A0AAI8VQQ6_9PEZI|nr:Uu.00g140350.m01.CDS01 [Anthostomella pinea]